MSYAIEHGSLYHRIVNHVTEYDQISNLWPMIIVKSPRSYIVTSQTRVSAHIPCCFFTDRIVHANDCRLVRHFQTIRHMASKRNVQHHDISTSVVKHIFHSANQYSCIPSKCTTWFKNDAQMWMSALEIFENFNQDILVIILMSNQMPAT